MRASVWRQLRGQGSEVSPLQKMEVAVRRLILLMAAMGATVQATKTQRPGNALVLTKATLSQAQPRANLSSPWAASMSSPPAGGTILSTAAGTGTTSLADSAETSCWAAGAQTTSRVALVRPTLLSHPPVSPAS